MAELATAFVRVRPNLTGFKAEAQAGTAKAGAALGKVFAFAFGTVAIEELTRHVVTVAAQQDAMFAKVQQLTKSAGADWEVYGKTVQEQIIDKSEKSGFAVDQLANAYGRLVQQTKNSKEALKDVGIASDVARARGTAVTQVATSLSRALAGNAQALSRLGIIVPKYTAEQDAVKASLADVSAAELAKKQATDKALNGTVQLNAEATKYSKLNDVQLAQLKLNLNAKLADAKASDKQVGAQKTLAEVASRFKGQGEIFGQSAAGKADRFRISIHELEVTIGEQLIPLLGDAADQGRRWAQELEHSSATGETFRDVARTIAGGVEQVAAAVGAALPAIQATATIIEDVTKTLGAGPILAAYLAYQTLGVGVAKYGKFVAAAEAKQTALAAAKAKDAAAAEADAVATTENTAALEANTVAAEENIAAKEGLAAANGEAAASTSLLDGAVAAFGPQLAIIGVAALAGGLYYLSTISTDTQKALSSLSKQFDDLNSQATAASQKTVAAAATSRDAAQNASVIAATALGAARAKAAADAQAAGGLAQYAADQAKVTQATLDYKQATEQAEAAQANLDSTRSAQHAARVQQADDIQKIGQQLTAFGNKTAVAVQAAGKGASVTQGLDSGAAAVSRYIDFIDQLVAKNHDLTAAQRLVLQSLQDDARQFGRIPDEKTVTLRLNDKSFYERAAAADKFLHGFLEQSQEALSSTKLTGADPLAGILNRQTKARPEDFQKAIGYTTQAAAVVKKGLAETVDAGISQGAKNSQADVAKATAEALKQGVLDAKQSLTSIGSTIGDQIGQVMDANLALAEKKLANSPAARRIGELQAAITRDQQRSQARDASGATADSLLKLQQLQAAFGAGAHTAEQDAQLRDATNAYLDAKTTEQTNANQIELDGLQKQQDHQKTALEKRNELEKTYAARRIADLDDELNRGVITEKQYLTRLQAVLKREGVNFKSAGKVLGVAFADGFREQLAGIRAQAKQIADLPAKVRGPGTGNAPEVINPRAAAAKAGAAAAGTDGHAADTAKNTAEAVAELKKLGAKKVSAEGTVIHFTLPADASAKTKHDVAAIVKKLKGPGGG